MCANLNVKILLMLLVTDDATTPGRHPRYHYAGKDKSQRLTHDDGNAGSSHSKSNRLFFWPPMRMKASRNASAQE